jgi:hypothetical protein
MAVVLFGAAVMPSAQAATVGSTQGQISALQAQILAGAVRIHDLTLAYEQANVQASILAEEVATDQSEIDQMQHQLAGSVSLLRTEAISSYTGQAEAPVQSAADLTDPSVQAEYLQVAAGDINDTVDQYRTQSEQLASAEINLKRQQQASEAAATATSQSRQEALAEAVAEQGQMGQLEVELSHLQVDALVAADTQKADAARAAATATQGLPVNNGIVTVVHTIVSQAPVTTPPVTTVAPTPPSAPPTPSTAGYTPLGGVWLQLRECESSDNYQENTGNGFFGAYQFTQATWSGLGYPGQPDLEPPQMQDQAAVKLQGQSGWGQWPACAAALGLLGGSGSKTSGSK